MTILEAKAKLDVPAVAARLFPHWKPATSCKAPWREDNSASFSVYDNGQKWKDHGTDEGGDAPDFLAKALTLSPEDGLRQYMELAGAANEPKSLGNLVRSHDGDTSEKKIARSNWPAIDLATESEAQALANLRNLPLEGVRWAATDGALRMSTTGGHRSWIIRSACGRNAQARRLDGGVFELNGQALKAKTLAGSVASIPIGLFFDVRWPLVVLVEGGPDVLAAYSAIHRLGLLDRVQVCGMLGASLKLPSSAVATFRNRKTRILQHNDKAGYEAADRWASQIFNAGGKVDIWTPDHEGSDLNDVFRLPADEAEAALGEAFDFAKEAR